MAADRPICHIWNHLHLVFQLELEQVSTSPSQGAEVAQGTEDGTTSAALNQSSRRERKTKNCESFDSHLIPHPFLRHRDLNKPKILKLRSRYVLQFNHGVSDL